MANRAQAAALTPPLGKIGSWLVRSVIVKALTWFVIHFRSILSGLTDKKDDDSPVVSCGVCSRWQHIQCHDRADRTAGRPRRNWNTEDFVCGRCRATQRMQYNSHHPPAGKALPPMNVPQVQPYGSYQSIAPLNPHASYPQDHRSSSHYTSGYKEPTQQSYYVRPTNGHQFSNAQPQYPQAPSNHSTISFNHYQPAEQGFSSSSYQSNQYPYGQATNTVQHYRQAAIPPYKTQVCAPPISPYTFC